MAKFNPLPLRSLIQLFHIAFRSIARKLYTSN